MRRLFQVITTRRSDLSNHCVAIRISIEQAQRAAKQFSVVLKNESIRCFIREVDMTNDDILNIVREWGRNDAASGFAPRDELKTWGSEFIAAYWQGFNAVSK